MEMIVQRVSAVHRVVCVGVERSQAEQAGRGPRRTSRKRGTCRLWLGMTSSSAVSPALEPALSASSDGSRSPHCHQDLGAMQTVVICDCLKDLLPNISAFRLCYSFAPHVI